MAGLRVVSTSDVALDELRRVTRETCPTLPIDIDECQGSFKSFEAPSWIHFLQEPRFWIETFVGGLSLDLAKAAGREAWRRRRDIGLLVQRSGDVALKEFAECAAMLRSHYGSNTAVEMGFPIPSDWFGTFLPLEGDDPTSIAMQVALFLAHIPALDQFLDAHADDIAGGLFLSLADDGDMILEWQDRATLTPHRIVQALPDVV